MVFHWSLSDSKSPQVSRTLLSILAVLNNAVVWMVPTCPPVYKSSFPFSYCSKSTNYNWYNCHLHVPQFFFNSLARSRYFSLFSYSFSFILWSAETAKLTILQVPFFLLIIIILVFWPRLGDPCVCQRHIGVYVCHFLEQVLGCAYTISLYSQF